MQQRKSGEEEEKVKRVLLVAEFRFTLLKVQYFLTVILSIIATFISQPFFFLGRESRINSL